ncbi:hypothetical protein PFJ02_23705 [Mycobacterium xenopi]|uniref:Uncharacterized protein n=1 Tax=Mycobacterium xenopi 4042 TaxID=1299334 RepID=X8DCL5_MYCXE|nr:MULTISPECIES: hypothetical protein [Mycobacterium]EUA65488.1 hypothetical protein I553_10785 [Mycobacterium xenopi 4042]MDA3664974.1 hypothetical protein [Mycobacterium xenopi]
MTALSANVARHLAARLADLGIETSGGRLQELALGKSATDDEVDAINELSLTLFTEYINRGGTNYDLVSRTLSDARPTAALLQLCGRLLGRVE